MFGRRKNGKAELTHELSKDIGLLGIDTRFQGKIRFMGTLRIDGVVEGSITSEPGSGSVLIVNQQASVNGDIVSDSVLISGKVEGNVHARERVEIYRSGYLKGDVFTGGIMIEGGAEFEGNCHMDNGREGGGAGDRALAAAQPRASRRAAADNEAEREEPETLPA